MTLDAEKAGAPVVAYPLTARVWFRTSTNEWVLELDGVINDTNFTSRHTQPAELAPEDVVGLPTLYSALDTARAEIERLGKLSEQQFAKIDSLTVDLERVGRQSAAAQERIAELEGLAVSILNAPHPETMPGSHLTAAMRSQAAYAQIDNFKRIARATLSPAVKDPK